MEINRFYTLNDSIQPSEPAQMSWQNYNVITDANRIARFSYRSEVYREQNNAIVNENKTGQNSKSTADYMQEIEDVSRIVWNNPNRPKTYLELAMSDIDLSARTAWHNWKNFPNF